MSLFKVYATAEKGIPFGTRREVPRCAPTQPFVSSFRVTQNTKKQNPVQRDELRFPHKHVTLNYLYSSKNLHSKRPSIGLRLRSALINPEPEL